MNANTWARPLIPLLISLAAGILLGDQLPGHVPEALGAALLSVGGILLLSKGWRGAAPLRRLLLRAREGRPSFRPASATAVTPPEPPPEPLPEPLPKDTPTGAGAHLWPLFFFLALGYLSIQPWIDPRFDAGHIRHHVGEELQEIIGTVLEVPRIHERFTTVVLRVEGLRTPKGLLPVRGKVRLTLSGSGPVVHSGDRIRFKGRLRSIHNYENPGGFDYRHYLRLRGIWVAASVTGDRMNLVAPQGEAVLGRLLRSAREAVSAAIDQHCRGEAADVMKALVLGNRATLAPELREAFNRAGVGHLLAISGLHIGIIASAAFFLFKWLLTRWALMLHNAWTQKGAALLTLVPVWGYGLMAGMSPSTQRAVFVVTVFLLTFLLEEEHDPVNTLAVAALLILIVHPPSLFSISFQLSFAAAASMIIGWRRSVDRPRPRPLTPGWFKAGLVSLGVASLLATLGTLPLVMLYFNQVALVGLLTNMILVPLVGFVVVPLGLIAVTLYPLSPVAAGGIIAVAAQVLTPGLDLAHLVAAWPYAAVKTFTPSVLEIVCFYLLAVGSLMCIRARGAQGQTGEKRIPPKLLTAAVAALLIVIALDSLYWGYQRFWHPDLRVTVIDVGHGSATLLELPGGYCLLVDAGGSYDNSIFDVGARVIAPVLWRKKIRTLDTLVLSHPNSDHLNGMFFIAQNFKVKSIWTNHDTADTLGYRRWEETLARRGIPAPDFAGLRRQETINGVTLKILYPPVDYKTRRSAEKWRDHNNSSLVLKVEFGAQAFLLPGDIMAVAEAELVRTAGEELNCTVLLAPHHGSHSSSTDPFLEMADPEIVIISGARRNLGQAGRRAVVRRYRERGLRVLHTATHGAIRMRTDGHVLTVNPFVSGVALMTEKR